MTCSYRLVVLEDDTYLLRQDGHHRSLRSYDVQAKVVYGEMVFYYADAETGSEIFPGKYFEGAALFVNRYAMVVRNERYFHINLSGKIVYRWRFSDVGDVNELGQVYVKHPRAKGWSLFCIPTGQFLTNPPVYR